MRWSWFRIAAAVIALSGIVAGFIVNIDRASRESQDLELVLVNYFSMFTIVSALLSVIALVAAATWAQRHPGTTREPLGIALGLFLGKQAGIFASVTIAERLGLARRPEGASLLQLWGIALLCGIGFTMSLFIAALAFPGDPALVEEAKLGVLAGSLLSAILGYAVLRLARSARP